jgi:hypothetical protein
MQKDFHYCAIKCLAQYAGFPEKDAQVVAYASQFVDDATAHKAIKIAEVPPPVRNFKRWNKNEKEFDPVCTAHSGLQYLTGLKKNSQRKVYIPFHFVPFEKYEGKGVYDYRVAPNSPLSRCLLKRAKDVLSNAQKENDPVEKLRGLIKLGIALHTFADTWSHQRFSGRRCPAENDIERIKVQEDGHFEKLGLATRIKYNIRPDVGHAEAHLLPDQSQRIWKYEHDDSGMIFTRNNTEIFIDAAYTIHKELVSLKQGKPKPWKGYAEFIKICFEYNTDSMKKKFASWRNQFPDVSFDYNKTDWRQSALDCNRYDWDHFEDADDFKTLNITAKDDLKWFLFHMEASDQREFVINSIRKDLL